MTPTGPNHFECSIIERPKSPIIASSKTLCPYKMIVFTAKSKNQTNISDGKTLILALVDNFERNQWTRNNQVRGQFGHKWSNFFFVGKDLATTDAPSMQQGGTVMPNVRKSVLFFQCF